MAAGDVGTIARGPGVLIKNPTSTSTPGASGNYGGTFIGATRDQSVTLIDRPVMVPGEEYGGVPTEGVEGGKWCVFAVIFRGWDADVIASIYANTATGSSGGKVIRMGTGQSVKAGHRLSDRAIKLLFVPNNTSHRAVLIYRALPVIREESPIALSIFREPSHALTFVGMPDATGRIGEVGVIGDLAI